MKNILLFVFVVLSVPLFGQWEDQTDITDWKLYAPLDMIDSTQSINHFGVNLDVDAATPEDIWAAGGTYPVRSAASPMLVSSSDDDDDVDSTGCAEVILIGLDSNLVYLTDTITMNGTSTVESTDTFYYINKAFCSVAGSSRENEGNIDIVHKTDSNSAAYILAQSGQSQQAIYVIEEDSDLLITNTSAAFSSPAATPSASPSADVGLMYLDLSATTSAWQEISIASIEYEGSSYRPYTWEPYTRIVGPAIVKLRVVRSLEDNQRYSGQFDGYVIKKKAITRNQTRVRDERSINGF